MKTTKILMGICSLIIGLLVVTGKIKDVAVEGILIVVQLLIIITMILTG